MAATTKLMTIAGPATSWAAASGEREDAGADHDADAEDGEIEGAERLLEPELRFVGVGDGLLDGLRAQKTHDLAFLRRVDR